jgi:hypothetical protein
MLTNAHAPTASRNVQRSIGGIRDVGMIVEKSESESGDYDVSIWGTETRSGHMRTCLTVPPEYGSTPWRNK